MKVLFLDFDGVLNEFYPNNPKHMIDNPLFEEHDEFYEQYKEVNNFIFAVIKKYDFDRTEYKRAPHLWAISDLDYDKIQWLNKIVAKTDCKIVYSTSWRGDGVENLTFYLCLKGFLYPKNCISTTGREAGYIDGKENTSYRGLEIKKWLEEHPEVDSFAILDDEEYDINPIYGEDRFLQVKGLTENDADAIIKILNKGGK